MKRLEGKVAVVTGGASGIGEGTVRLFVEEGANVVIADIQDDLGNRLADSLTSHAVYQRADVSKEEDVGNAIERAVKEYGRLDCMFNNAGFSGTVGPIEEIPVVEYDLTMDVLLKGVFLGIKHATPVMRRGGGGSIISTSSVAGILGGHGPHVYSAAKAAVIQLTRSAALELGQYGIRVNCICPGAIATPIFKSAFPGLDEAAVLEAVRTGLARLAAIPRAGEPDDIARAAAWLASDESSYVTGHTLVVDGGMTAGPNWLRQPAAIRIRQSIIQNHEGTQVTK